MAVVGGPPDLLEFIFVDQVHTVVHAGLHVVLLGFEHLKRVAVEAVQAVPGTEPHKALLVLQDSHHGILTQPVLDGVVLNHIVLMRRQNAYLRHQAENEKKTFHYRGVKCWLNAGQVLIKCCSELFPSCSEALEVTAVIGLHLFA